MADQAGYHSEMMRTSKTNHANRTVGTRSEAGADLALLKVTMQSYLHHN